MEPVVEVDGVEVEVEVVVIGSIVSIGFGNLEKLDTGCRKMVVVAVVVDSSSSMGCTYRHR